jgi:hypothetical protein
VGSVLTTASTSPAASEACSGRRRRGVLRPDFRMGGRSRRRPSIDRRLNVGARHHRPVVGGIGDDRHRLRQLRPVLVEVSQQFDTVCPQALDGYRAERSPVAGGDREPPA